jgi:sugar phosphate isomerase/epimerase
MTLPVFQSLWAMEDLPANADTPWTPAEWIEQIGQAGFDGVAVDLGARQAPDAQTLRELLDGTGLARAVLAFVSDDVGLDRALAYADTIEAPRLVVCAQVFGFDFRALADTVERWHARALAAGVTLELETHRGTMTNEVRATVALLGELDPSVGVAVDLSHHVCGCELPDTATDDVEALIGAVLARATSLQGRVASRGQIQLPLHHVQYESWVTRFRGWWQQGFAAALSRGSDVWFCTELGTRPYALTDVDGRELSDRWAEALLLKQWAHEAYAAAHTTVHSDRTRSCA